MTVNHEQCRVILGVSMETLHSSSNKLSSVCEAVQPAPHWGSARVVCNEPCYWSWHCGGNLSCGCVCCARDKAAGAVTLPEKGVWRKCKTHINENWMWLCTIPWTPAVCTTAEARRLPLVMHVFILYHFAAVKCLQTQTHTQDTVLPHLSDASWSF